MRARSYGSRSISISTPELAGAGTTIGGFGTATLRQSAQTHATTATEPITNIRKSANVGIRGRSGRGGGRCLSLSLRFFFPSTIDGTIARPRGPAARRSEPSLGGRGPPRCTSTMRARADELPRMPFRDDREANRHRVVSLEHENEDLRARLEAAEQERDALAKERATPATERSPGRGSRWLKKERPQEARAPRPRPAARPVVGWVITLTTVFAILATVVYLLMRVGEATRYASQLAVFDGVLTVALDVPAGRRGGRFRRELVTFDLASGKRLAKRTVDSTQIVFPRPGNTRAWVKLYEGKLALIDFRSLELVLSGDELGQRFPELAQGFALNPDEQGISVSDGSIGEHALRSNAALALILADGTAAWVDTSPRLHRERPEESVMGPIGYTCYYYEGPSCEERQCFAWAPEAGSTAKHLTLSTGGSKASERAERLYDPAFVKRLDHRCALEIDGGVLVRHETSAVRPRRRLLSLLDARDGSVRWTRPVDELADGDAMPIGALRDGDRIFLLLGDPWRNESINLREVRTNRLVLAHLAAGTGEPLATFRLK